MCCQAAKLPAGHYMLSKEAFYAQQPQTKASQDRQLVSALPHQAMGDLLALLDQDAASNGKVPVEPRVPQATPIWLHIDHPEPWRLAALGLGLQLQARAARTARSAQS